MTRKQSSSYIKNVCALRQSPNTISLLSGHGAFSLQTATLSQGCSQARLSSPRTQQGGQGSSLAPHTLWQLLLSPRLLSPSHTAAFLPSSCPTKAVQATQQPALCSLDKLLLGAVKAMEEGWGRASLLSCSRASCVHSASKTLSRWVCILKKKKAVQ